MKDSKKTTHKNKQGNYITANEVYINLTKSIQSQMLVLIFLGFSGKTLHKKKTT